jgi:hypothetical protein
MCGGLLMYNSGRRCACTVTRRERDKCTQHMPQWGRLGWGEGGVIEVLVRAGGFLLLMRSNSHPTVGSPMVYASKMRGGCSPLGVLVAVHVWAGTLAGAVCF